MFTKKVGLMGQTRQNDEANGQNAATSHAASIQLKLIDERFRLARLFLKLGATICLAWVVSPPVV